jgi:hypothetical protein
MTPLPPTPGDATPLQANPHLWPTRDPVIQTAIDADNLRLLEIAFYIAGGMTALFSCFFLIHFCMFLVFGLNPQMFANSAHGQQVTPPPAGLFLGMAAVIGVVILLGWAFGALQIYAGRCLRQRRSWLFVMIISAIECIFIPWGTTIGVCSLILLNRPSVRPLFQ